MSTSGFEALPVREGGRRAKRPRKLGAGVSCEGGGGAPAAPAHSYTVTSDPAAAAAEGAPFYESAQLSSAERVDDEQPGEMEGSGGMGKWEYLDHTADVQIHTCARFFVLSPRPFRRPQPLPPHTHTSSPHPTPSPPARQGAPPSPRPLRSRRSPCGAT